MGMRAGCPAPPLPAGSGGALAARRGWASFRSQRGSRRVRFALLSDDDERDTDASTETDSGGGPELPSSSSGGGAQPHPTATQHCLTPAALLPVPRTTATTSSPPGEEEDSEVGSGARRPDIAALLQQGLRGLGMYGNRDSSPVGSSTGSPGRSASSTISGFAGSYHSGDDADADDGGSSDGDDGGGGGGGGEGAAPLPLLWHAGPRCEDDGRRGTASSVHGGGSSSPAAARGPPSMQAQVPLPTSASQLGGVLPCRQASAPRLLWQRSPTPHPPPLAPQAAAQQPVSTAPHPAAAHCLRLLLA